MNIICPQCNVTYRFSEKQVPDRKASFQCKRCGTRIMIEPPAAAKAAQAPSSESGRSVSPPVQASSSPNSALVAEFPEAAAFEPQKYALDHLLVPNKKGRYKTRINKLKLKLLGAVHPVLDRMLGEDEQVMHLAGSTAYYPAELLLGNGWMTMLYNRYIIVGTNKRLLAVNTNYKMNKPTHYFFQFPYSAMKKISKGIMGTSLVLTRKKGKRRTFTGIRRAMAAELKSYISTQIDPASNTGVDAEPKDNLCPSCFTPLAGKLSACPKCRSVFKSPRKAALRSLLLPGWGDFYLGHRFLGVCEMLGSILVWGLILTMFFSHRSEDLVVGLFVLLFYNGMDCLLTLHMGKKGYSLESSRPGMAPAGRLSTSRA